MILSGVGGVEEKLIKRRLYAADLWNKTKERKLHEGWMEGEWVGAENGNLEKKN